MFLQRSSRLLSRTNYFVRASSSFTSQPVFQFNIKSNFNEFNLRREFCSTANETTPKKEENETETKPKRGKYSYWKLGFIDLIRNPLDHKELFYYPADANLENTNVCVVYDRMPKAKKHLLVLPTALIQKYNLLSETHIELLEEMRDRAHQVIKEIKETEEGKDLNFKLGFQAVPGMLQIHLHIISDDMQSPNIKNKRHWNTFNTEFFVPPEVLIDQLKKNGCVKLDETYYNNVLKGPLACPHCQMHIPRVPELMEHIAAAHPK